MRFAAVAAALTLIACNRPTPPAPTAGPCATAFACLAEAMHARLSAPPVAEARAPKPAAPPKKTPRPRPVQPATADVPLVDAAACLVAPTPAPVLRIGAETTLDGRAWTAAGPPQAGAVLTIEAAGTVGWGAVRGVLAALAKRGHPAVTLRVRTADGPRALAVKLADGPVERRAEVGVEVQTATVHDPTGRRFPIVQPGDVRALVRRGPIAVGGPDTLTWQRIARHAAAACPDALLRVDPAAAPKTPGR